jgi:nitric-oxide synthase
MSQGMIDEYKQEMLDDASAFLDLMYKEGALSSSLLEERLAEVKAAIARTGTYWQTYKELSYGAMVAWRNHTRCIGRLHWRSLQVKDRRHVRSAAEVFDALVEHLLLATNGGRIRPLITVFAPQQPGCPGIRIWNSQLIRYAGYLQADGSVIGDPSQVEFTNVLRRLGWKSEVETPFDVLPLIIQMPGEPPQQFTLPAEVVLEVPLSHPVYPWFAELGLRWYALPAISDMSLEIAGVSYTAAPFNGWYMCTEIGARNLGDVQRYNLLPVIAQRLGLRTEHGGLWKDRALIELNEAVLYSFKRQHVKMIDHHTATQQFVLHEQHECAAGRMTPADWGWIIPPISASSTPVFHCSYENKVMKPKLFYQAAAWQA